MYTQILHKYTVPLNVLSTPIPFGFKNRIIWTPASMLLILPFSFVKILPMPNNRSSWPHCSWGPRGVKARRESSGHSCPYTQA